MLINDKVSNNYCELHGPFCWSVRVARSLYLFSLCSRFLKGALTGSSQPPGHCAIRADAAPIGPSRLPDRSTLRARRFSLIHEMAVSRTFNVFVQELFQTINRFFLVTRLRFIGANLTLSSPPFAKGGRGGFDLNLLKIPLNTPFPKGDLSVSRAIRVVRSPQVDAVRQSKETTIFRTSMAHFHITLSSFGTVPQAISRLLRFEEGQGRIPYNRSLKVNQQSFLDIYANLWFYWFINADWRKNLWS